MSPEIILLVLVLLACPVAMIFLHRGRHSHQPGEDRLSLTELYRLRARLDRELASRQQAPRTRDGSDATA